MPDSGRSRLPHGRSALARPALPTGRSGGEEFLVLAPDTGRDGALMLAEKLRVAVSRVQVHGLDVPVTASIGVATLPDDAGDGRELLRRADRALYAAKATGRNRVEHAGAPGDPKRRLRPA